MKKNSIGVSFFCVLFLFVNTAPAFCAMRTVEYLCETGVNFYRNGRYDEALREFNKALIVDPNNAVAKNYITVIFLKDKPIQPVTGVPSTRPITKKVIAPVHTEVPPAAPKYKQPKQRSNREEIINQALNVFDKREEPKEKAASGMEIAGVKITGEAQARLGIAPKDTYWKRANWDLNEKNWRTTSNDALNRRENSYDPRIYDRLRVNLDTDNETGLGFHSNITVDPWSFTGKSEKVNLKGSGGDVAQVELKYWSNTGYTLNQTISTYENGDSFNLPEIKVVDGHTSTPVSVKSAYNNIFTLPETKISRQFQPVRELMFDYKQDGLKLVVYPMAYENQALTFDDPLRLSNNRTWWEDSPWLHGWQQGIYNLAAIPADFTKGYWDNSLSFSTRDSEGQRLTALRGFSLEFNPLEETSIATSVATPKNLWQDYAEVDNFLSATRIKQNLTQDLMLGLTATTRMGYNTENRDKIDAKNYVLGTDLGYEIIDGLRATAEIAYSQSEYDLTNSDYETKGRGNAYNVSVFGRFPFQTVSEANYNYDSLKPGEYDTSFNKFKFTASRMDESFDQPLSSYVETRDDEFWSRHLHFRTPFKYYYQGEGQLLSWDDIKSFRIGNGIDIGRNVLSLRVESSLWDKTIDNLFDVRNVHGTNGKFIENVSREEFAWNMNERLTTKLLGIYHRLPKTKAGTDPFIFDPRSRRYVDNDQIEGNKDPSIATGSLGAEYKFFDWLALNGVWEYTNDITLGYDNFPRGVLLNDTTRNYTYYENNNKYRDIRQFLYSQNYFPKPPYPYYNIFKTGLRFNPAEKIEIYLDYTRNPYEKAGQVDDNMNHMGFQIGYLPTEKLSLFFKYSYSRWQDLDKLTKGITKVFGHHNFFTELIYRKSDSEDFTFQYGEASRDPYMGGVLDIGWDPYGGSLRTIDTQHIVRLYYRRKF
ncbi:MAG: tetratricopeptide repeat protein [Candidatus Omnitrophica bacterium]|nr:tetratricopeptide repeat protein [Candidatus Omnitrophota bacterium]MDD5592574.1 tetratricopeptide repeat protein [Candidatus Omnitrophota bacterium]